MVITVSDAKYYDSVGGDDVVDYEVYGNGTAVITMTAKVVDAVDWVENVSTTTADKLSYTVKNNTSGAERSATILLTATAEGCIAATKRVTINQTEGISNLLADLPREIEFQAEGGSVTQDVTRYATTTTVTAEVTQTSDGKSGD